MQGSPKFYANEDFCYDYFQKMCGRQWRYYANRINNTEHFDYAKRARFLRTLMTIALKFDGLDGVERLQPLTEPAYSDTEFSMLKSMANQDIDVSSLNLPEKCAIVLIRLNSLGRP